MTGEEKVQEGGGGGADLEGGGVGVGDWWWEGGGEETGEDGWCELMKLWRRSGSVGTAKGEGKSSAHVRLDEEGRVLQHGVEEVQCSLKSRKVVQMVRNLNEEESAIVHSRTPHRRQLTCSPPHPTR